MFAKHFNNGWGDRKRERIPGWKKEASDMFFCLFYSATSLCSFFSGKKREILDDVILMEVGGDVHYISFFPVCLHMILFESRAFVCEKLYTYFIIIKNCSNNNVKDALLYNRNICAI